MTTAKRFWRRARAVLAVDDAVMVTQGRHRAWRRLVVIGVLGFALGLGAIVAVQSDNPWASIPASMWLGGLVSVAALGQQKRALAYWSGWLKGRTEMVVSLSEAHRRGMTIGEWLEGEYDRQHAVVTGDGFDRDAPDCGVDHA